jgi:hypothetical protein
VGVQLIVFFAAISGILKRGIYGRDKQRFYPMKTKGYLQSSCSASHEPQMQVIRFMNGRFQLIVTILLSCSSVGGLLPSWLLDGILALAGPLAQMESYRLTPNALQPWSSDCIGAHFQPRSGARIKPGA